jgi:excisionase family DNA binding protein
MTRMTVKEAAEYLGITPALLRYLMDRGELKIGKVIRNEKRNTYLIYREYLEGVKL